ncbi:MAG: YoaK family protein [Acidobacteriaceae bacterium]|nr:YoaK family protein [Acidobacteriaceae bacterium]
MITKQALSSLNHVDSAQIRNSAYAQKVRSGRILGACLALVAGYLDGYGLLVLGTYVSFMSGNSTLAGVHSGQAKFSLAIPSVLAILSFVIGSIFGNAVTSKVHNHSHRILFGLIGIMIGGVVLLHPHHSYHDYSAIMILSIAMGMLNPALSKVGAEAVSLTFMTGTLSRIGGHLYSALAQEPLKDAQSNTDSHWARALIDGSIWFGFLLGAGLSGMLIHRLEEYALVPPCFALLLLAFLSHSDTPAGVAQ